MPMQTFPGWAGWAIVLTIGFITGALVDRIPRVRRSTGRHRWAVGALAGFVAGVIAWSAARLVFGVDLP